MMQRALYRCDGCKMELHLLGPVERACPSCGGTFIKIKDYEHPLDAVADIVKATRKTEEERIDEIIEAEFPDFMRRIEEYLYAHAEMDRYQKGDEDEEEGVSN